MRKEIKQAAIRSDESGVAKLTTQVESVQKKQKSQGQTIHELGTVVRKLTKLRRFYSKVFVYYTGILFFPRIRKVVKLRNWKYDKRTRSRR